MNSEEEKINVVWPSQVKLRLYFQGYNYLLKVCQKKCDYAWNWELDTNKENEKNLSNIVLTSNFHLNNRSDKLFFLLS